MMIRQPTILVLIQYYLPGNRAGGSVRAISNLVTWFGQQFHFKIITRDHDLGMSASYPDIQHGIWMPVGEAEVRYLNSSESSLWNLKTIINVVDYDVLYLDGFFASFTVYALLLQRWQQIRQRPTMIAPRGQLHPGSIQNKIVKKKLFLGMAQVLHLYRDVIWHFSSAIEQRTTIQELGMIPASQCEIVPDLPTYTNTATPLPVITKMAGSAQFVFLSRIVPVKNLDYALDLLRNVNGQVKFDIYGPIENEAYWSECEALIKRLPANITVRYCGVLAFHQVHETLTQYHSLVLPTQGENFGHVILEALCAGCPPLISDQTIWHEIDAQSIGRTVALERRDLFIDWLQHIVTLDEMAFQELRQRTQQYGLQVTQQSEQIEQMRQLLWRVMSAAKRGD